MALTDKLTAEKAGLESYLDSERGAKLEQNQIDRLDTLNSLLGIGSGGGGDASAVNQATQITAANLANTRIGDISETASAGDTTAGVGLNGRLQRIAQRISSLISLLPTALGVGGGIKVDGSGTSLPVSFGALPSGTNTIGATLGVPDLRSSTITLNSATLNASFILQNPNGGSTASFAVSGLTASGATLIVEASDNNGSTYNAVSGIVPVTNAAFTTFTTDRQFRVNVAGRNQVQVRVSGVGTGNISVTGTISDGVGAIVLLPTPQLPSALGVLTSANSLSVVQASDSFSLPSITNKPSAVFVRGANTTARAADTVWGGRQSIALPVTGDGIKSIVLTRINLITSLVTLPAWGTFTLFLFQNTTDSANIADNNAFTRRTFAIDSSGYILSVFQKGSNDASGWSTTLDLNVPINIDSGVTSLQAYLVSSTGYTPAAATADTITARFHLAVL